MFLMCQTMWFAHNIKYSVDKMSMFFKTSETVIAMMTAFQPYLILRQNEVS